MEVKINVDKQKLKVATNLKTYVSGTQEFIKFTFNFFDNIWDSLKVFAQFRQGEEAYNVYLDENNSVYLPSEITPGECILILHGSYETIVAITDVLILTINENHIVYNAKNTTITESLYDQLVTQVKNLENHTHSVSDITTVVPIEKGGTNAVSKLAAEYNILSVPEATSEIEDNSPVVYKYLTPSKSNGVLYSKPISLLWEYIKKKINNSIKYINLGEYFTLGIASSVTAFAENGMVYINAVIPSGTYKTTSPVEIFSISSSNKAFMSDYVPRTTIYGMYLAVGSGSDLGKCNYAVVNNELTGSIWFNGSASGGQIDENVRVTFMYPMKI